MCERVSVWVCECVGVWVCECVGVDILFALFGDFEHLVDLHIYAHIRTYTHTYAHIRTYTHLAILLGLFGDLEHLSPHSQKSVLEYFYSVKSL